jgi:predicted nucleotidyltransferase
MSESTVTLEHELTERIRQELPSLSEHETRDLARSITRLVEAFRPQMIYAFGSRARGDAHTDSDVDLMVVVDQSDQPTYRRAQDAFRAVGLHDVPLDILVRTLEEFDSRSENPASLTATIRREGLVLYAA